MAEVPKIVRERLRAGGAAIDAHPDADTLAAFAERNLPSRERDTVTEHLSQCGDCREIVALALPASEAVAATVAHSRSPWLSWSTLRWGFAAAGIVLVAALGLVQYQRHNRESLALYKAPAISQAKNDVAPASAPAPSAASADQKTDKELDKAKSAAPAASDVEKPNESRRRDEFARNAPPPPMPQSNAPSPVTSKYGAIGGPLAHGPKMGIQMNQANQWQQQNANAFIAVAPTPPSQAVTGPSTPPDVLTQKREPPAQVADNLTLQSETLQQQVSNGGSAEQKVDRAKPLETVIVGNAKTYVGAAPSARLARATSVAGAPQWTIDSNGGLRRSLDQGASWQDVHVNVTSPAAAEMSLAKKEQAKVPEDEKQASAPMVFRAVAVHGADVWAGGVNGLLYHSTDAGSHWIHVVPSASGVTLSGDIVSVSFPDAQHGRIATSTSEVWVTGDGGQSWNKE